VGNFINSTTLIPLIPLVTSFFILILLASFNRTLNRLTKPVTAMVALSLLSSAFISLFDYFKKIEEELVLSEFLRFFEEKNLVIHLKLINEKIIVFFSFIMIIIIKNKSAHVKLNQMYSKKYNFRLNFENYLFIILSVD